MSLQEYLHSRRIIVCCGSGGVGKTTTAASLALEAARQGLNVLVLTIDPAKRLANSLGLSGLGNKARQVPSAKFAEAGVAVEGTLWAMMLDTKRTFDELVETYASSPEVAERILNNALYQNISGALAGSQEYMAMEKLYELYRSGEYDLIVLDTPPTRHALDFLDAPKRMTAFLDGSILQWFIKPYFGAASRGLKAMERGTRMVLNGLEKVTGLRVLKIVSEFFLSFEGMYDGFKERAAKVSKILRSKATVFVLVSSPEDLTLDEAIFFHEKLRDYQMPFGGFIVNKLHQDYLSQPGLKSAYRQWCRADSGVEWMAAQGMSAPESEAFAKLSGQLTETFENFQALAEADRVGVERLHALCRRDEFVLTVPYFAQDIHDIHGLTVMNGHLFGPDGHPGTADT